MFNGRYVSIRQRVWAAKKRLGKGQALSHGMVPGPQKVGNHSKGCTMVAAGSSLQDTGQGFCQLAGRLGSLPRLVHDHQLQSTAHAIAFGLKAAYLGKLTA